VEIGREKKRERNERDVESQKGKRERKGRGVCVVWE
jgi:hypothetical protein